MILNSRNNAYDFRFPRKFIPTEVAEKYSKYLNKVPGALLSEPVDFINYSIQGLNIPGLSFDPITEIGFELITFFPLLINSTKELIPPL